MTTPTHERRWNEGKGERYMKDQTTRRCQALAKTQLRRLRIERNMEDTEKYPNELFWPDAQCTRPALMTEGAGLYACKFHGGMTPSNTSKTILESMPYDLAGKYKTATEDPFYFSRRSDMNLLQAHLWELLEKLDETQDDDAWNNIEAAYRALSSGNIVGAEDLLKTALTMEQSNKDIWREIYTIEDKLKDLTNTEIKTASALKLMASMDQVKAIMSGVQRILLEAGDKFIDDPKAKSNYLYFVSKRLLGLVGFPDNAISGSIESGSGESGPVT